MGAELRARTTIHKYCNKKTIMRKADLSIRAYTFTNKRSIIYIARF